MAAKNRILRFGLCANFENLSPALLKPFLRYCSDDNRSITTNFFKCSQGKSLPCIPNVCNPAQQFSAPVYADCVAKWTAQL